VLQGPKINKIKNNHLLTSRFKGGHNGLWVPALGNSQTDGPATMTTTNPKYHPAMQNHKI